MGVDYIAYYTLLSVAALGALFVPSVRNLCLAMLTMSAAGYAISNFWGHTFDILIYLENGKEYIVHKDGFVRALIDVSIGSAIVSIFKKNIPAALIALTFAVAAYTHMSMTLAVIDKEANFFYTNYEILIATTSLAQAILLFGVKLRDYYRYYADTSNSLPNIWRSGTSNTSNKDLP